MLSLFDFKKKIDSSEKDHDFLYNMEHHDRKVFNKFVITQTYSKHPDTVGIVAYCNKYQSVLSNEEYYKLLSIIVPPNNIYAKGIKSNDDRYDKKTLEKVSKVYNCSHEKAKDYVDILTDKQLDIIYKESGINN